MDLEFLKRLYEEGAEALGDKINKCARISILKILASDVESEYNEVKRPLRFSIQEFNAVTGLKCIDEVKYDLKSWVDDGGFWSKLLKTRGKISLKMIMTKLIKEANKWTRVDRLRLVYFCVAAGLLMAIDEKTWISHDYIKLIMDYDKLRAYPWGLRCFDHLVEGVVEARSDLSKTTSYVLEGFAYALQIWIMKAIPDCGVLLGAKLNVVDHVFPRCSNWTGVARAVFAEIINVASNIQKIVNESSSKNQKQLKRKQ